MAIDPNLFLNPNAVGNFNDTTPNTSGYGALSGAELNQTYFAYYDGCGRQDPELPKQTTFFIKYLIDANGNVVKPQPNDTSVINMVDNFETGKPVIITTRTPTVALNPLLGEKTVTHVGELSTLLVTNSGSGKMDYITTMSFQNLLGISLAQTASDYNMTVLGNKTGPFSYNGESYPAQPFLSASNNLKILNLNTGPNAPDPLAATWSTVDAKYTFNNNTNPEGNSRVKIRVSLNARVWSYRYRPILGWQAKNNDPDYVRTNKVRLKINKNGELFYRGPYRELDNQGDQYVSWTTDFFNFLNGDYLEFFLELEDNVDDNPNNDNTISKIVIVYTVPQGGTSQIQIINENQNLIGLIDGATAATANFFTIGEYPDQNGDSNAPYLQTSVLTASQGLTNMYREGTVQTLPSSVLSASYMQPWQPFYPLLPGDRIIFENNKNNVHTITEIIPSITASNGSSSFGLRVVPGITTGSIVNNFCIYRILNNGSQIMVDQEKPTGTAALAFRGFIRPKYISQELETKFTDIINKLEADGTIV